VKDKHENKAKCLIAGDPAENILPPENRSGKIRRYHVVLGDIPDVFADFRVRSRPSINCDAARGGFDNIEQHPNDGCLAGTVGSQ